MYMVYFVLMLLFYTYFGYPLVLLLLSACARLRIKNDEIEPKVSLIIAAYNEEQVIAKKIENSLDLEYPKEKLEIIVVSDASDDSTDEIVKKYVDRGVILHRMEKRGGKISGHHSVVSKTKGEILIFSDATGLYKKDVVRKLVANFADKRVGCVGGILRYVDPKSSMLGAGEGLYWRYEMFLRKKESMLGKLPAVSGSIYAVRKELYVDFPSDLADDLIVPLTAQKKGYFVVYEQDAVCVEETISNKKQEFAKRSRIANQNIRGILYMKDMLNVFKYRLTAFILFSHKFLRLVVPVAMILLFILTVFLAGENSFLNVLLVLQLIFYLSALAGYILEKIGQKNRILAISFYFCTTNIGLLFGVLKFILGKNEKIWQPYRDEK